MIAELVADGITDAVDLKSAIHHCITHNLCEHSPPDPNDRAYFLTHDDLRNHIHRAKQVLQHTRKYISREHIPQQAPYMYHALLTHVLDLTEVRLVVHVTSYLT